MKYKTNITDVLPALSLCPPGLSMASIIDEISRATQSITASRNSVLAVYTISIYEWLDCLPTEVDLIYPSKWSSIKIAYFLCRYYQLLVWPLVVFSYLPDHNVELCHSLTKFATAVLLPLQIFAPAVMLMRAYAFAGRHKGILAILLFLYLGLIASDILFLCIDVPTLPDITFIVLQDTGCFPDYSQRPNLLRLVAALGASSLMDFLSLMVIAIYCLRTHSTRGTLGRAFIRQGLGAFVIMLVIHAGALGTYLNPQSDHNGVGLPYALTLSNVVACRLILDLRRKAQPTETEIHRQHSQLVDQDLWIIDESGEYQHFPVASPPHPV
ncbi:hypothetical protein MIND_00324100 [Mycena indigotica]|uniref:DUF6533 domain-containing protein n=1 Tax=Mycena indigotica TaxID=2126181 RepID=A0A8H6T200_9AGAR|nr:uncharacterized protein MIND_00324100 [Mycena indigotica]KAF7309533.1 hypothetical protein MIND_00324100 [Mycena indigotica]